MKYRSERPRLVQVLQPLVAIGLISPLCQDQFVNREPSPSDTLMICPWI